MTSCQLGRTPCRLESQGCWARAAQLAGRGTRARPHGPYSGCSRVVVRASQALWRLRADGSRDDSQRRHRAGARLFIAPCEAEGRGPWARASVTCAPARVRNPAFSRGKRRACGTQVDAWGRCQLESRATDDDATSDNGGWGSASVADLWGGRVPQV